YRLYPEEKLVPLTRNSIGTRTALTKALAEVRARGFARSREESEEGVASLAVGLHSTRSPRLAVNVSVPVNRMGEEVEKAVLGRL
ncbi:IclR family transcriptional regulator domain-containing protein, partial [Enterococcus faecalis]|uniref:IclR family transcriptional regulator domain-containing protein n=1 Tax=Enterococcus faecalis TaxID=1351 RepID=UPI003D6A1E0F